jgi:asparagine synthase (glutamine-hydrolysing)
VCGICGFMNLNGQPIDEAAGHRMVDLLWHRGPDGEGALVRPAPGVSRYPAVFLGHRRLKIIDLSDAAQQPLPNEARTVWVIFNGEIYNFRGLRDELQQAGHAFHSRSDTETIVHAYEEFGDDFVERLDGMFAFALWDERRGRLILARDRSGKKPLFYMFDGQRFTFASEIKALLVCPWVNPQIATEHIPEYLTYGYVHTPRTLYRDVYHVPPGSYLVVEDGGLRGPQRYWELRFSEHPREHRFSVAAAARRVRELLTEAVARRLVSDVPLGALLSGGLDSSIVVGIMSRLMREPVRTFTVGFTDDLSFDERPFAAAAAKHFGTDHTEMVVRADAVSLLELLSWHHDQPYGDASAIPTFLVSKLARQHVTVALNGDGGDEVFAGYERFLAALLAERLPPFISPLGRTIARWLPDSHGYTSIGRRLQRFFADSHTSVRDRFVGWMSYTDFSTLTSLLTPGLRAELTTEQLHQSVDQWYEKTSELPLLQRLLQLNFVTYLCDDLHVKMDRMSMANALETRSPLLDTALVEFVASLSPDMKIRRGQLKYILRVAFRDMLPPSLLKRGKHGFGAPVGHWFRHQLRPYVEEMLLAPDARSREYLEQGTIRRLVHEHLHGVREHGRLLWVLLTLEVWLRMLGAGALRQPRGPSVDYPVEFARVTQAV